MRALGFRFAGAVGWWADEWYCYGFVGMLGVLCLGFVDCVLVVFWSRLVWLFRFDWLVCLSMLVVLLVGFVGSVNSVGIAFLLVGFRICCDFWLFVCYFRRLVVWRSGVAVFGCRFV